MHPAPSVDPHNGPHDFRPIYFQGRQIDNAKAWTFML
jgi:hypothetical protein